MLNAKKYLKRYLVVLITVIMSLSFSFAMLIDGSKAYATDVVTLQGQIYDPQNVLSSYRGQIEEKLVEVNLKTQLNIYLIFVPTFTLPTQDYNNDGVIDANDWVHAVAKNNNLSDSDLVFAVGTASNEVAIYASKNGRITQKSVNNFINLAIKDLRNQQWGDSALNFTKNVLYSYQKNNTFFAIVFYSVIAMVLLIFLLSAYFVRNKTKLSQMLVHHHNKNQSKTSHNSFQTLFEKSVGIINDHHINANNIKKPVNANELFTPTFTRQTDMDDIYADFYRRASTKDLYGSYYATQKTAIHDDRLNEDVQKNFDYQKYLSVDQKGLDEKSLDKYYDN